MAAAPAPFPSDSNMASGQPVPPSAGSPATPPSGANGPSAFGGGASQIMQAITSIEQGLQTLAQTLPSLAPFAADTLNNLRMAVPQALSGNQAGGGSAGPGGGAQPPSAPGMMPPPGMAPQGQ